VEVYKAFGDNLPVINDDPAWVLPMPARYVIGTGGVIAYSEVTPITPSARIHPSFCRCGSHARQQTA
jgi:hypothetical protein